MLIKTPQKIQAQQITMPGAQDVTMRLLIGRDDQAPTFAMRQFTVQPSGHTPLHQHPYEHEVLIQSGSGVVQHGHATQPITAGQVVFVPADELHQFRNSGDEPLVFICLVPVSFDCDKGNHHITPGT